jgi:hypothetical protein
MADNSAEQGNNATNLRGSNNSDSQNANNSINIANTIAQNLSHGNLRGGSPDNSPNNINNVDPLSSNFTSPTQPNASSNGSLDDLINNLVQGYDSQPSQGLPNLSNNLRGSGFAGNNFINSSQASFVIGIISNWYMLVAIPAMTVTYNVFKTLQEKGILDTLYNQVSESLKELVSLSYTCPQLIYDVEKFMNCLGL